MGSGLISGAIIGAGIALFFKGRSSGSFFKRASGVTFVVAGVGLLSLRVLIEAKKAGVI